MRIIQSRWLAGWLSRCSSLPDWNFLTLSESIGMEKQKKKKKSLINSSPTWMPSNYYIGLAVNTYTPIFWVILRLFSCCCIQHMYDHRPPTRVYLLVTFNTVCLGWCYRVEIVRLVQLRAAELLDASDSCGPPWISFTSVASYVCHSRQSRKHYTWIAITAPCTSFDTRPNIYIYGKKEEKVEGWWCISFSLSFGGTPGEFHEWSRSYWCPPCEEVKAKSVIFTSTLHLKKNKMVAIGCDQPACCRRLLIISILAHVPLWVVGRLTCRSMGRWSFHPHMWSMYHILPTNLGPIICFDCHYSHSQLECIVLSPLSVDENGNLLGPMPRTGTSVWDGQMLVKPGTDFYYELYRR